MNGEELFEKMSLIDPELIEEAEKAEVKQAEAKEAESKNHKQKHPNWKIWGSLAACICLLITSVTVVGQWQKQKANHTQEDPTSDEVATGSISIPAIQLPTGSGKGAYDMVGLIVYQGRIYTQVENYEGEKAKSISSLVGEQLGVTKGNIDEWSKQDAYAEEFASNVNGDVYAVNGYSPEFRICISGQYGTGEENEETIDYITFYENLNGISLTTGADLFEDRLKVKDNWETIQYQSHESWDNSLGVYNELVGITDTEFDEFVTELNSSEFVDMTGTDIYSWIDQRQTHMYLTLKDGTSVELRLVEGGYVGYQGLGWYFVKMPGSAFDSVFEACFQ